MAVATVVQVVAAVVVAAAVAEAPAQPVVKAALPTRATTATLMPTVVAAMPSHAAICQPLNKPCVAQVNARHVVMVVATAAVTVVRRQRLHVAPVASQTRCAPAST